VTVQTNLPANIVVVKVRSKVPILSEVIARQIFTRLNEINTQRRRSQAAAEVQFAEERSGGAASDLEQAESDLASFQLRNRSYTGSPELALQYDRLRRRVDIRQQVFSTLLQNRERARLEENRNTPVITLIDPPDGSAVKVPRGTALNTLVGLTFGAFFGFGVSRLRRIF
jgi:tyrosine-protein kinase Etk/Wzc